MQRSIVFFLSAFFFLASGLSGAESIEKRKITVSGKGALMVVPDEVSLSLGVEIKDKDIDAAKTACDKAWKKLLATVAAAGVKASDQQASELRIEPEYDYSSTGARGLRGYTVRRMLWVTLKKVSDYEALVTNVLKSGANSVSQGEWKSSKIIEFRSEARLLALKEAKKKAELMAAELGQKIGKPLEIVEQAQAWSPVANQNVRMMAADAGGGEASAVPGQIEASASVVVTFELE